MKKKKLYILVWNFSYGSASGNRLLAYANSAAKKGLCAEIIALLRFDKKDFNAHNDISIKGLFPCRIKNQIIAKFVSLFSTFWFLLFKVKSEDRILLYASPEYLPLCLLLRRKQTYYEVTECPDLFRPRTYSWNYYKKLWKCLNGIFVISRNLKEYFEDYGVAPEKVHVVNMIVEPSRFESVVRNMNVEKYIAYCGNINDDSKDGVRDLIASFVKYHEKYGDRKLYIIGPITSQEQKNEYDNYLKQLNALDNVVFTDAVSPSSIPQYFVDAEMLVLARPDNIQAKYGFPTKLGEYLLSGRPVVLTDVGNITIFLKDQRNAFIAKPGDIDSIAQKMIDVSANPNLAEVVAKLGKQTALRHFNSDKITDKILDCMYTK